jgi:hypothetical protein
MTTATDNLDRHQLRLAADVTVAEAAARTGVPSVDEFVETMVRWGAEPPHPGRNGRIDLTALCDDYYGEPEIGTVTIVAVGEF